VRDESQDRCRLLGCALTDEADDQAGAGAMSAKAWENIGFACGGFAVAMFLLWVGAIGAAGHGAAGVLVIAIVLAVLCVLAFVRSSRTKDRS
jgi:uncharacterized membrane protein